MKKIIISLLSIIFLLCIGLIFFTSLKLLEPREPNNSEKRIITIEKGTTPKKVSELLFAEKVIRNPMVFYWYGKINGHWGKLKAGEYDLSPSQSANEVFKKLTSGLGLQRVLLIKEGQNIYEIGDLFESQKIASKTDFLNKISDLKFISSLHLPIQPQKNLEGFLFPDTYYYTKTTSYEEIIRAMAKKFTENYNEIILPQLHKSSLSPYELITLASMVEKETGAPVERPIIAGVFYNRLKKKMKLQSDPTTIYGIWHRYKGNIHKSDLLEPTPYNTYTVPALPIGPICNPGKEAMLAIVEPKDHDYLYFVSKNEGTHLFSSTYEEHLKAVNAFQVNAAAREGKSWRDLKKK